MTNDYGENWERIKNKVRKRDNFQCQECGIYSYRVSEAKYKRDGNYDREEKEEGVIVNGIKVSGKIINEVTLSNSSGCYLHVHHIKPFDSFNRKCSANGLLNLVSLCPSCHSKVENDKISLKAVGVEE